MEKIYKVRIFDDELADKIESKGKEFGSVADFLRATIDQFFDTEESRTESKETAPVVAKAGALQIAERVWNSYPAHKKFDMIGTKKSIILAVEKLSKDMDFDKIEAYLQSRIKGYYKSMSGDEKELKFSANSQRFFADEMYQGELLYRQYRGSDGVLWEERETGWVQKPEYVYDAELGEHRRVGCV